MFGVCFFSTYLEMAEIRNEWEWSVHCLSCNVQRTMSAYDSLLVIRQRIATTTQWMCLCVRFIRMRNYLLTSKYRILHMEKHRKVPFHLGIIAAAATTAKLLCYYRMWILIVVEHRLMCVSVCFLVGCVTAATAAPLSGVPFFGDGYVNRWLFLFRHFAINGFTWPVCCAPDNLYFW